MQSGIFATPHFCHGNNTPSISNRMFDGMRRHDLTNIFTFYMGSCSHVRRYLQCKSPPIWDNVNVYKQLNVQLVSNLNQTCPVNMKYKVYHCLSYGNPSCSPTALTVLTSLPHNFSLQTFFITCHTTSDEQPQAWKAADKARETINYRTVSFTCTHHSAS